MKILTEKDLCAMFVEAHPRREHLWFEVDVPTGRADIVYREYNITVIYEAKLNLNLELLQQCIARQKYAHMVYAVVPKVTIRTHFLQKVFSDYGIGVIDMHQYHGNETNWTSIYTLQQNCFPKINRHPLPITLYEENRTEIAGSKNAGITPFGIMVKKIRIAIEKKGPLSIDKAFAEQDYYGTLKQFKSNIYQWCRRGVISDFNMESGMLFIDKNTEPCTKS